MANGNGTSNGNGHRPKIAERVSAVGDKTRSSQAWNSIFRPGSIYRKGYTDSPRNRSYVIMNNVLYHLHPVKVKRHAVKVSYTLCLGGLSFFLFILLTVTGIFLMFFYRPTVTEAYASLRATTLPPMLDALDGWAVKSETTRIQLDLLSSLYAQAAQVAITKRHQP